RILPPRPARGSGGGTGHGSRGARQRGVFGRVGRRRSGQNRGLPVLGAEGLEDGHGTVAEVVDGIGHAYQDARLPLRGRPLADTAYCSTTALRKHPTAPTRLPSRLRAIRRTWRGLHPSTAAASAAPIRSSIPGWSSGGSSSSVSSLERSRTSAPEIGC